MLAGSKLMNRLSRCTSPMNRKQGVGRFLAGFQVQRLAVARAVVADIAGDVEHFADTADCAASCGTKPMCRATTWQPSSFAKSAISFISCVRAARVSGGTRPTVRATVGISA